MLTILVYRPSPEFPTVELAVSKPPNFSPLYSIQGLLILPFFIARPLYLYRDPLILLFGTGCPLYYI